MRRTKSRKITKVLFASLLAVAAGGLSGCSMDTPTALAEKKVEVVEETRNIKIPTAKVNDEVLSGIAADYRNHGDGPLSIVVTYSPAVHGNSAMNASDSAARMVTALRRLNVDDVKTEILPIHNEESSLTLVSFTSFEARAPEGCQDLEAISDSAAENYRDYRLGCATETYLARQVARPKDLLGREGGEVLEDGRKRSNVLEVYKSTVRNERLEADHPSE